MLNFFKKSNKNDEIAITFDEKNTNKGIENEVKISIINEKNIVNKMLNRIDEMEFATQNLIDTINGIYSNVEHSLDSLNDVMDEISSYSAIAQQVYASTTQSKEIAIETLNVAQEGNVAVDKSITAIRSIEKSVSDITDIVNMLSDKALKINDMLNIIKDISEQTNLLSLNASIEAARAGEAGRGFAVVAAEVKKLAQRSSESAEKIAQTIREINDTISKTVDAMNKSKSMVDEGVNIADNTKKVFDKIISAVKTTVSASDEINQGITKQVENFEKVVEATNILNKNSNELMKKTEYALLNAGYTKNSIDALYETSKDLNHVSNFVVNKIDISSIDEFEIITNLHGIPENYDPAMSFDSASARIFSNVHAGLLIQGNSTEVFPGLAKSWYVEDDNRTWVFNLRRGAKFHNGREITADDVKYSFERLLSPKLESPNAWFLGLVEGSDEYQKGRATNVSGISVVDKYKIKIRLKSPYTGFLLNLAQSACAVIAREDAERGTITGCGPYYIDEANENKCVLNAFKDYFGGAPYVDRIVLKFKDENLVEEFLNGKYDFIYFEDKATLDKLKTSGYSNIIMQNMMSTTYGGFNLNSNSALIRDKEIRQAINYAIDKNRIIDTLMKGMAQESRGPLPPGMLDNKYLSGYSYNPQKAREILNRRNIKNETLIIQTRTGTGNNTYELIAEMIKEDLEKIGIRCSIEKVLPQQYLKAETIAKCHIFISGWIADTGDPDNYLEPLFNPENFTDFTRYENSKVLELMKQAREVINPQKRIELYKEIQRIIVEDAPWIFLYHPQSGLAIKDGIVGVRLSSLGKIKFDDILIENKL
ncbi:ABC transporter substrate-binding protein [Caloramator mitchellensis]|uniref:ABC transporter substrate-binding protein n=1 Tax=Caloramator mitchellensis TaxID=908809 RepID=UPI0007172E80|nr:ABC transporter substrate-binding protein [Caloramator mitchellensis]